LTNNGPNQDFIVTVMLQQPEVGGEFEFAPMLRGPNGEENYDKAGIQEAGALRICSLFMNRLVVSNMFYFPEYIYIWDNPSH
jgi:hypothetical protein